MPSAHPAFAAAHAHVLHYTEFRKRFKVRSNDSFASAGKKTGFQSPKKHSSYTLDEEKMNNFILEFEKSTPAQSYKPSKALTASYPAESALFPHLYQHLHDRVNFAAKFDNFLYEQNLHPAGLLAHFRDVKAEIMATATIAPWMAVASPTKPSASTVTSVDPHLATIHNWIFGAQGFLSGQPVSTGAVYTKALYQAAWTRASKHFDRDSDNLKVSMELLQSDWERE